MQQMLRNLNEQKVNHRSKRSLETEDQEDNLEAKEGQEDESLS